MFVIRYEYCHPCLEFLIELKNFNSNLSHHIIDSFSANIVMKYIKILQPGLLDHGGRRPKPKKLVLICNKYLNMVGF